MPASELLQKAINLFRPLPADAPLPGAPTSLVEGPVPEVVRAAEQYAGQRGLPLKRQGSYAEANPRRGRYIAEAYDKMEHAPDDPAVASSYQALADETMAQWQALQDAGAKIDFLKPGMPDPYPNGPRDALADLRANNHLYVFPTEAGFGTLNEVADNPLLKPTGIEHGGHPMLVNDAFRAVHDYFGHGMEGATFGARGEENAWQAHKRLFSPEALPALTSETRGQNSWVNFGPYGEANRANPRETVYADQKTGLLPGWAMKEGGMPLSYRAQQAATAGALAAPLALGGSSAGESYDPAAPEPPAAPLVPLRGKGELTAGDPSMRDNLAAMLSEASGNPTWARQATGLGDLLPGVGAGLAVDDTKRALERGNFGEAGLSALGVIPELGPAAKAMLLGLAARRAAKLGSVPIEDMPMADRVKALTDEIVPFADQAGVDMALRQVPGGAVGDVELTDLFARETGKGAGTKVMTRLKELADSYGLNIYTTPSEPRNVEFYGRFGFERPTGKPRYTGLPLVRYPPLNLDE